ncbi:Golgi-associated plant pathogenesis-related protein 1 [Orchesella cincta]|uniref:Golgi-associated plant pathogenesis-related protein 1 n=1 Tax=Orchesella cincta TaxID=48709 RepID=A0A1D2MZ62_ORCCI|nr:Golgi-associated plant pathogenesis-related protein 1 [Orchesella cincta]
MGDQNRSSAASGLPQSEDQGGDDAPGWGWPSRSENQEDAGWGWPSRSEAEFQEGDAESSDQEDYANFEDSESRETRATASVRKAALDAHNAYRRRHKVPDLRGDSSLDNRAQNYANLLAKTDSMSHSKRPGNIGENLAWGGGATKEAAVKDAVKRWYDEIQFYKYSNPGYSSKTGHFTQVVWKSTKIVGIGIAYSQKKKWWVVVANYSPAGNSLNAGEFKKNVLPRK